MASRTDSGWASGRCPGANETPSKDTSLAPIATRLLTKSHESICWTDIPRRDWSNRTQVSSRVQNCAKLDWRGKSDQNVINNVVVDFLHSPYRSIEEPLDVLFWGSGVNGAIEPFSVGISVGSAKSMAALSILHVVTTHTFEGDETRSLAPELMALCVVRATTDPADDVFSQIKKTISKKIRVSERSRPNPVQLEFAFGRVVSDKQAQGDKRKAATILHAVIKEYNGSQPAKGKLNSDEREAVLMLHDQEPAFKSQLKAHWRNYPVSNSAVPVSFLALPWLSSSYEPSIKKSENPLHHQICSASPKKNVVWLRAAISRFQHRLKEQVTSGKTVNLRGAAAGFRSGTDQDTFFHCVGMYMHFEAPVQKCTGVQAFREVEAKFYRGALERELVEKVKTKDPKLSIDDFRFVQAAMDYDPTAAKSVFKTEEATTNNLEAGFKLDSIVLKAEQESWADYLRTHRAYVADCHNAKVAAMEARWKGRCNAVGSPTSLHCSSTSAYGSGGRLPARSALHSSLERAARSCCTHVDRQLRTHGKLLRSSIEQICFRSSS